MISYLLLTAALALDSSASSPAPAWQVGAAFVSARPFDAREGVAFGGALDLERRLGPVLFARLHVARTSADRADRILAIEHSRLDAGAGVGVAATRGVGRVFVQVGLGVAAIFETTRAQDRFAIDPSQPDAPLPGDTESYTVGPLGFAEAGLALTLAGGLRSVLAVTPSLAVTPGIGQGLRVGLAARLGVAYGF